MSELFPKKLKATIKYHLPGSFMTFELPEKIGIEMTGIAETSAGNWELEFKIVGGEGKLAIEGSVSDLKKIASLIKEFVKEKTK